MTSTEIVLSPLVARPWFYVGLLLLCMGLSLSFGEVSSWTALGLTLLGIGIAILIFVWLRSRAQRQPRRLIGYGLTVTLGGLAIGVPSLAAIVADKLSVAALQAAAMILLSAYIARNPERLHHATAGFEPTTMLIAVALLVLTGFRSGTWSEAIFILIQALCTFLVIGVILWLASRFDPQTRREVDRT